MWTVPVGALAVAPVACLVQLAALAPTQLLVLFTVPNVKSVPSKMLPKRTLVMPVLLAPTSLPLVWLAASCALLVNFNPLLGKVLAKIVQLVSSLLKVPLSVTLALRAL